MNPVGRDFVVGDVHGCFSELLAELDQQGFDCHVDRLFSVGDLIDRGPESADVVDWLARPWFHAVRGNHEQMALDYLSGDLDADDYWSYGGAWFIELSRPDQNRIAAQLAALPVVLEIETSSGLIGLVHGDCPFASWHDLVTSLDGDDALLLAEICMSSRDRIIERDATGVRDVAKVFVGHTPVVAPFSLGNVHYVDTGAVYGHKLTVSQIC